jgi:periplasmic divalent cation tolerance protein
MTPARLHVIFVTASSMEEASQLAEHLVRERLAACVNILGPVRSIYVWDGKLQKDSEYLLLIKAAAENFSALEQAVRKRHSYTVPEILALPVADGSPTYLEWACAARPETKPDGDE